MASLTEIMSGGLRPRWSPNGRKIVFKSPPSSRDVFVHDLVTLEVTNLTNDSNTTARRRVQCYRPLVHGTFYETNIPERSEGMNAKRLIIAVCSIGGGLLVCLLLWPVLASTPLAAQQVPGHLQIAFTSTQHAVCPVEPSSACEVIGNDG